MERNADNIGVPNTEEGEDEEEPAFKEDSRESLLVCDGARAVEANDRVGKIGVETETRGERDGKVGKEAHKAGGECSYCRGGLFGNELVTRTDRHERERAYGDQVTTDDLLALCVCFVGKTNRIIRAALAYASSSSVCQDGSVDANGQLSSRH